MYNLLRCEFFKLRKSRMFILLIGLVVAYSIVIGIMTYSSIQYGSGSDLQGIDVYFEQLSNYLLVAVIGSLIATVFICKDFENKTIQDSIACGCSRSAIILSKSLVYFLAVAVVTVIPPIVCSTLISIAYGFGMPFDTVSTLKLTAITLTTALAYASCLSPCVLFSFLGRKPVITLAGGIFVLFLGVSFLKDVAQIEPAVASLISFTPYGAADALLSLDAVTGEFLKAVTVSIIFMILILVATIWVFRKSEVR